MAKLEISEIQSLGDWLLHRERFNSLAGNYFTRRFGWLSAAWLHCSRPGDRLSILCVRRAGEPIAYLPLYAHEHPLHGRCLKFVGSGKPCSDQMGIFVAADDCADASAAMVDYLRQTGESGKWDWLELSGVQMRDPRMHRFLHALRRGFGSGLYEQRQDSCWEVSLSGGWDGFIARCSRRSRHECRKLCREYIDAGRVSRLVATNLSEVRSQFEIVTQLHQRRRHSIDSSGCLDTEGFERFLEAACNNLVEEGTWFSMVVEIDGRPAGGVVGALNCDRLSMYLVGMEPELASYHPGTILNLSAVRYALEQNCTTFDLMRGNEEYKRRLGGVPVGQYVWRAAAPRVLPRLRGTVFQAGTALKRWLQSEAVAS